MIVNLFKPSLALFVSTVSIAINAAPLVAELKPQDLGALVTKHKYVVIQATSPDKGCGYCIGADKILDQAVALPQEFPIVFACMQWTPWRAIPSFGSLLRIGGLPNQFVFVDGKYVGETGGRAPDAPALVRRINERIVKNEVVAYDDVDPPIPTAMPAKPAAKPLTEEERTAMRTWIRYDILQSIGAACTKRFPQQADAQQKSITAWRDTHQAPLDKAAKLMLTRSGQNDMAETTSLMEQEKKLLQQWQVNQLGMPMNRPPLPTDCERLALNFPPPALAGEQK